MPNLIKKANGKWNNSLEFYENPNGSLSVVDTDCQMERVYIIGTTRYLGEYENDNIKSETITSFEQVINAWSNGKVWF
jgi:hypothetical protein